MQQIFEISDIKSRAEAMGLSLKQLARAAGINPSTAYRGFAGLSDNRGGTLRKLTAALLEREGRMREHMRHIDGAAA